MNFLIVVSALCIDWLIGEPKRYHPLVGFGSAAIAIELKMNTRPDKKTSILNGALSLSVLVLIPVIIVSVISHQLGSLAFIFNIIVLYWAIGLNSLITHTKPILTALIEQDLAAAKAAVSWIVSRNTESMNEQQVVSATVESTLENGCDGVFAALFWGVIGGAPLVVAYRLINTLDAMWGYRTERYQYFGKPVAKLDDIVNYIPARLTALSYALLGNTKRALECWRTQAHTLSSPNGGPVMTSGAGSLNIKLGGPTIYHNQLVNKPYFGGDKTVEKADIKRVNTLIIYTAVLWCAAILVIDLAIYAL